MSTVVSGVAAHPEDDLVLATAVGANADYLVTGVKQLLETSFYEGTTILSPREFLTILEHSEG
jgi:predicted nucleic acid-binding protein